MRYEFIDLFCGAGGFSCGLEQAGFTCIGGIELEEIIAKTHALNHKSSKTISGDIRNIPPEKFAKIIGKDHVDVIIGGPPCPTFSTIGDAKIRSVTGKPTSADPRNQLFLEYLKYVDFFRPDIFVIENVPTFITKYKGKIQAICQSSRIKVVSGIRNTGFQIAGITVSSSKNIHFFIGIKMYRFEYSQKRVFFATHAF